MVEAERRCELLKLKKKVTITVFVILLVSIWGILSTYVYTQKNKPPILPEDGIIQTEEDAIIIGMTIIKRVYPQFDYDNLEWNTLYYSDSEVWSVFCYESETVLGGGYPQIDIKKKTGEVIDIYLTS